ncbi:MAG: hemerythrin domain-containing protein [Sulfuritalea sp.]|nr:hemerythrin domain-containing protein [Sulfuritalea sp.]
MPNRVPWNQGYETGNETLDQQHRDILAQCHAMADHVVDTSPESDLKFQEIFDALTALAREHFASEADLLARCGCPTLDEHKDESDEFDYLAADIATTENFDKLELQRFLSLWWVGHIVGFGKRYRACIDGSPA